MPDLLLYGDTERNPALRHEIPITIVDPFLYAEVDGRPFVMVNGLERERVAAAQPDAELVDVSDLGFHELLRSGQPRDQVWLELTSRAAAATGVRDAIVDFGFPLGAAERLRADGITLAVDDGQVKGRRRVKSEQELAGIRRAQGAADAGMAAAAALLRRAEAVGDTLYVDGDPLLSEMVRAAMRAACAERGALLAPEAIVTSVWQGTGHESGAGPLPAGLPIQVDLWPRDEASGTWADMTRTFVCAREPPEEVRRQERLVREALEQVRATARAGVAGSDLYAICCELFEGEGYRTQRTGPGEDRFEGFQFALGHGVGLEVHEDPALSMSAASQLVAGDVIAVEPGLWDRHVGGVRYEDLLLITESGCETLTDYPYELTP